MLREQEAALRAEFEAALNGQLAEQYEAFVRFNLDQIQRRHNNSQDISCKFILCIFNVFSYSHYEMLIFSLYFLQIFRNNI